MADEEDFFEDPRAPGMVHMMRVLDRIGAANMRELIEASGMTQRIAHEHRDRLCDRGFVRVDKPAVRTTSDVRNSLTKEGKELLERIEATRPIQEKARKNASPRDS